MQSTALQLQKIRHSYGTTVALNGVDLQVGSGEFFGFLGPNGAGKSTLMKIVAGFLQPDSGEVVISGRSVYGAERSGRNTLGYVPQEIALYETLSPMENLSIFGHLQGVTGSKLRGQIELQLQAVGLWDRRKDLVKTFSGGMMRRLNIAAALLHQPDILLCDEPTVGIDPQSRNAIFSYLAELNRQGITVLYTTHYMEEVERLCDRIAIIDHGCLLACGDKLTLLKQHGIGRELLLTNPDAWPVIEGCLPVDALTETRSNVRKIVLPSDFSVTPVFAALAQAGIADDCISLHSPNLESLFLKLTGSQLRD